MFVFTTTDFVETSGSEGGERDVLWCPGCCGVSEVVTVSIVVLMMEGVTSRKSRLHNVL
jgi:hypothetical protein